ncbi:MAG: metallophosphatase family protein [Kiritimatiellae bacterium]|nr:metallophosphatase family protein [Kiritimatiellia bacterium]
MTAARPERPAALSRRGFLGTAGAFALIAGCRSAAEVFASREPRLKFGVASDIHCQYRAFCDDFENALVKFRAAGVDAVVIAGDLADTGSVRELKFVADCWDRVFPGGRGKDGRRVERMFVTGNHDHDGEPMKNSAWRGYYCGDQARIAEDSMALRPGGVAGAWEQCFGEKFEPIYRKNIRGYDFIGAHWCTQNGVDGVEEYMRRAAPTLDPARPFFYVQHCHPRGTVYADWAWGEDDGRSKRALSAFPNAVAFSGHSHFTLTSDWSIWQGEFTSVGTASLSARVAASYGGRENSRAFPGERPHMPQASAADVRQGMIVTVYDDVVRVDRRDFSRGLPLGEPWVFTVPAGAGSPYVPARHAASVGAPAYAVRPGADEVAVSEGAAAHGCDGGVRHVTVSFPVPSPKGDARAFDFEVAVIARYNNVEKIFKVKRALCPSAHLPPSAEVKRAECVFAADELPRPVKRSWTSAGFRFAVTPVSSMGVRGETFYSKEILCT